MQHSSATLRAQATRRVHNRDFGAEIHDIGASCDLLKTYTEQVEETLIFLGFGYHDQNVQLIAPQAEARVRQIFGTTKGFSEADTNIIANHVYKIMNKGARLGRRTLEKTDVVLRRDLGCGDLLKEYRRSLTQ